MAWTIEAQERLANGDLLTLRRSGADFEIRVGLTELMSSKNPASERAMAALAAARVPRARRVLIGGLGMGYTVRAALDAFGPDVRITVAELIAAVIAWNRGLLADLARHPLDDPRVTVMGADVADALAVGGFDVILLDVDNGPEAVMFAANGALYGSDGVRRIMAALASGGVLGLWAADPSPGFEVAVGAAGFALERRDIAVAGLAHTVYLVSR